MKTTTYLMFAVAAATGACAELPEDVGVADQAISAPQGSAFQGSAFQGSAFQGAGLQGSAFQGVPTAATTISGVAAGNAAVNGATLVVTKTNADGTFTKRYPDKICTGSSDIRNPQPTLCTTVNLATSPSPLTGVEVTGAFLDNSGAVVQKTMIIGAAATSVGALSRDPTAAMYPLNGTTAATCGLQTCDNAAGCRTNCDLWLYDVRFRDVYVGGVRASLCPAGEQAIAFAGSWSATGQFTPASTQSGSIQFTFACTGGTIAKCARWGYRPFGQALSSDGVTSLALAPYHQSCVRAAAAAYCGTASGASYTTNGTLVDIYDYTGSTSSPAGLIRSTPNAPTFVWESSFDNAGAIQIDRTRHSEIYGLSDPNYYCPGRFDPGGNDALQTWNRTGAAGSWTQGALVNIASAGGCAHSTWAEGRWLHPSCSACAGKVASLGRYWDVNTQKWVEPYGKCSATSGAWDASCVAAAAQICTAAERDTSHSECTTGAGLPKWATACTARVVGNSTYAYCATTWDANCVAAANRMCVGGKNNPLLGLGLCGTFVAQ